MATLKLILATLYRMHEQRLDSIVFDPAKRSPSQ